MLNKLIYQPATMDFLGGIRNMKKILATMLCLAMLLSMAACGGGTSTASTPAAGSDTPAASAAEPAAQDNAAADEAPAAEEPESTGPKVFRYGTDANSTTFDPASDLQTNSGSFLVHAVGETLWTVDADGNMVPKLAESVEFADDDSSMTIKLRQGVKFSNGNDLTADDVLFTLQHMMEMPRTASMYTWLDMDNSKAEDDYTVVLAMNSYDASLTDMLSNASCMILDKETCEADPSYGWLYGTGPYKLAGDGQGDKSGWEESVKYTLVRNDLYWGDQPYYDELDVHFYSEESTRYADFQAGNLDAVFLTEATYLVFPKLHQHAAAFVNSRALGNLTGHPALGQKVLSLGFGKTEAVLLQQGLDDVDITEIHEKPAFCRNIGGGFTLIIWETAAKCKREIRDGLAAGVLCYRLTFESSSSNTQSVAQCHW